MATKVEKAGSAFDRVLEKATGVAASTTSTSGDNAAKVAELEKLAQDNRIKERLEAIKNNLGK